MFRSAAVLLGLVGFVVFNFGADLCGGIGQCGDVPVSSRGFLRPQEVQFVMLLTSIVGMLTALVGLVRGPNTLIPARIARPFGRIEEGEPLGVRGTLLFGAAAVLIGMIVPLHGLAAPIPDGRALTFYLTVGASLMLVAYFGWHLGTDHGR
jgi:hypothetical protein